MSKKQEKQQRKLRKRYAFLDLQLQVFELEQRIDEIKEKKSTPPMGFVKEK